MKEKGYRFVLFLVVLALAATPAFARPDQPNPRDIEYIVEPAEVIPFTDIKTSKTVLNENKYASGPALYTVLLQEAPLASYRGGAAGLAATSPSVTGAGKLDAKSPQSLAYRKYLAERQQTFIAGLEKEFARSIEVKFTYQAALNGFAAVLTPEEAAEVALRGEVRLVERSGLYQVDTDAGPAWIGAPAVWDVSELGEVLGTMGEGVIVGILDTGINADHPSFAATGPIDTYVHTNPLGEGVYLGVCDIENPAYNASFVCNDKLIGAWEFAYDLRGTYLDYPTPEDENGHGSHTASTAAGNILDSTLIAPTTSINGRISGVAPHANIIAYDVCHNGGCPFAATSAAVDQAVSDGVDVINYSISGGEDPYNETTELAFLEAYHAGVFVSTSAGNQGPDSGTVGHRGGWVSASAAASHNRALPNSLVSMSGDGIPPADITGLGFTSGYGPANIVYAGDYDISVDIEENLCPPGAFPVGTFSGQIVVCDRGGDIARVDKAQSVKDGGAGGFVLANDLENGASLASDAYVLPGVHITYNDGSALKTWLAEGEIHTASISGWQINTGPANGDILAAFSSRGPNTTFDILKPDLTAPGVDIWAAIHTPDPLTPGADEYGLLSGTSMASPHTAGAAALMTALHRDWSAAQILSALTMSADKTVLKEDRSSPAGWFDMGSGRLDLSLAAKTGLVLDETYENFLAADPDTGGDVKTLNLPSLTNSSCIQSCSWTRTFTSVAESEVIYTITASGGIPITANPSSFTASPGASQAVTFTADSSELEYDVWKFATVSLTPDDATFPTLSLPVSILPPPGTIPALVTINTRRDAGSQLVTGFETKAAPDLTLTPFRMVRGTVTSEVLPEDPTKTDPYDDPADGVFFILVEVPAGAPRFISEISETTAADLDLFVGLDDGDGIPQASELVSSSTGTAAPARVDLLLPEAGSYWVLVQNFHASAAETVDAVKLVIGVVPGTDGGIMTIVGPASVAAGESFNLTVYFDISISQAGERWYGLFAMGSTAETPDDIGYVPVDILRHPDDVIKSGPISAARGDRITYQVNVDGNITPVNLNYTIKDTIPDGLTLDPDSIKVSAGSYGLDGNTITWSLPMPLPYISYSITTNGNDPLCDTGFNGYLDLESSYGYKTRSDIPTFDTSAYTTFLSYTFDFFGKPFTGMSFTDDGFTIFDAANNYDRPWYAQTLPNVTLPNNLLAMLWQDMKVVYDAAANRGITLAVFKSTSDVPMLGVIEYDDVQLYVDSSSRYDFEILAYLNVNNEPGNYEYIFAYDNLNGDLDGPLTIGAENAAGTIGTALVNKSSAAGVLSNDLVVCLDRVTIGAPATMTYDVVVDQDVVIPVTNSALSITNNPGSVWESAAHTLMYELREVHLPIVAK